MEKVNVLLKKYKKQIFYFGFILVILLIGFYKFLAQYRASFWDFKNISEQSASQVANIEVKKFLINKSIYSGNWGKINFYPLEDRFYQVNLGNTYLFSGIDYYLTHKEKSDYKKLYQIFNKALYYLSGALPHFTGQQYQRIYYNKVKAENLAYLMGLKYCVNRFAEQFSKFELVEEKIKKVEKLLTDLISVIKQKLSSQQDPYLKKCLKNFLTALVQSYINLSEIQMLFDEYKKNLTNMFYAKIRNVDDCIANDNMFDGINQGLTKILSGLNAYDTQYSKLYIIILKGNDQHLRELCEKSYILNKKFSKNNQQLSEGFQKLQEYLSKPKQYSQNGQGNKKKENKGEGDKNQKKEGANQGEEKKQGAQENKNGENQQKARKENAKQGGAGEKYHYHIDQDEVKKLMEQIIEKNYNRIQQMENIKNNPDYNPKDILDQLFKEFYGSEKGFEYNKDLDGW